MKGPAVSKRNVRYYLMSLQHLVCEARYVFLFLSRAAIYHPAHFHSVPLDKCIFSDLKTILLSVYLLSRLMFCRSLKPLSFMIFIRVRILWYILYVVCVLKAYQPVVINISRVCEHCTTYRYAILV